MLYVLPDDLTWAMSDHDGFLARSQVKSCSSFLTSGEFYWEISNTHSDLPSEITASLEVVSLRTCRPRFDDCTGEN